MTNSNWNLKDRERAQYLLQSEDNTASDYIQTDNNQLTVIIPKGLPALGISLHGMIMLAPLPLLFCIVFLVPVLGGLGGWEWSLKTILICFGCSILCYGLFKLMQIVMQQKELFPQKYFVTLGENGVAMHFNRFFFPWDKPEAYLEWNAVRGFNTGHCFYLPGIFFGRLNVPCLKILGNENEAVLYPYLVNKRDRSVFETRLNELISKKISDNQTHSK